MHKYIYMLAALFMLLSCGSSEGPLPKEKMEKVMWDVAQSSEFLNGYIYFKYPNQDRTALNDALLQKVFKVHHITKKQFLNTLDYYKQHPKELKVVLDSIVSKKRKELNKNNTEAPPSSDIKTALPTL